MDSSLVTTPPPQSSRLHTPSAPRFGCDDFWQPHSSRKSARIAHQRANRTPSPSAIPSRQLSDHAVSLGSPHSTMKKPTVTMTSPAASHKKRRVPAEDSVSRRVSSGPRVQSITTATISLGLPTPAKTPCKAPTAENKANIKAIARNLFHNKEEALLSPKKSRGGKHVLNRFSKDEEESPIEVYTDSCERVPQVDISSQNPFYGQPAKPADEAKKRRSERDMVYVPGEGNIAIEEAVGRDDGMLITFRGKRQFRRFAVVDNEDEPKEDEGGLERAVRASARGSLGRVASKPNRVLFPAAAKAAKSFEEQEAEEAATDIEDQKTIELEKFKVQTPGEQVNETVNTPSTPKFAPASPPSKTRVTRQGKKSGADMTPVKSKSKRAASGSKSPFDSWPRQKSGASKSPSEASCHKRSGGAIERGPSKRTKA